LREEILTERTIAIRLNELFIQKLELTSYRSKINVTRGSIYFGDRIAEQFEINADIKKARVV
jgi:hypothetical protein